jgi:benzaldehyde dehydrogenase (NAD)
VSLLESSLWDGKIFVNRWTAGGGGAQDVLEPATGNVLGRVGVASAEDVAAAATSAAAAQVPWAKTKPEERAAVLRRAGDLWELHAAEIHEWIMREGAGIPAKAALETASQPTNAGKRPRCLHTPTERF